MRRLGIILIGVVAAAGLSLAARAQEFNLLALGEGTLPVVEAPCYSSWPPVHMLDDAPNSGWASEEGKISNNVFVFETVVPVTLGAFEFDTASIDGNGRGAKDVIVEVSATSKTAGFELALRATLSDRKNGQRFPAAKKVTGRWVRLTIINNHGDDQYSELMSFRGYGPRPGVGSAIGPIDGTYQTSYGNFHVRQQGTSIAGCYEDHEGLFDGTLEGRVAKLAWTEHEGNRHGPAFFVFSPDGKSFRGYWWYDSDKGQPPAGDWTGSLISSAVGSCPHWSGSVEGQLKKDLVASGRARLYGILFDTDSARIRPESQPTLDEVGRLLASEPKWALTIEGHTDATGTPAHNQTLSEQRADSVKAYLVGKGVDAKRLNTVGFGQSKPVADNATELGRAQNRRVELVRK
jgi:outer membrane protein OmpA-like peptidoglycan-associated protein